jgi:hypothetical protein
VGAIDCHKRGRGNLDQGVARFPSPPMATAAGGSRAALLASASLIALAAFGAPGAAFACSGVGQMISTAVNTTVNSNGGAISVLAGGQILGTPDAVDAFFCALPTLDNSGKIIGAANSFGEAFAAPG